MENICFPLKPDNNTGHGLPLLFITRAIAKIAKSPLMVGTQYFYFYYCSVPPSSTVLFMVQLLFFSSSASLSSIDSLLPEGVVINGSLD